MKRLLASLAFVGFLLSACYGHCPKQDVVDVVFTPFGLVVITTQEGCYAEDRHSLEKFLIGEGWITLEEYKVYLEELEKAQELRKQEDAI